MRVELRPSAKKIHVPEGQNVRVNTAYVMVDVQETDDGIKIIIYDVRTGIQLSVHEFIGGI